MRRAFYAGAASILTLMVEISDESVSEDAGVMMFDNLLQEAKAFSDRVGVDKYIELVEQAIHDIEIDGASQPVFDVIFMDADGENEIRIQLPFAPYPGLMLQAPWDRDGYVKIVDIYWDVKKHRFEIYSE